jgi:hypothetical protein
VSTSSRGCTERRYRPAVPELTNEPDLVLFGDFTHVKFYRRSLRDACELEGLRFDGFRYVDD